MAEGPGLLERLDEGPVICAEGYLFELERRGYLQAGAFVPEVVLAHPEKVTELHREFSDEELVDLALCVGAWIAFGRLNRVFDVDGACRVGAPLPG